MDLLIPNKVVNRKWVYFSFTVLAFGLWWVLKPDVFPGPLDVVLGIGRLLGDGVVDDIWASMTVNLEALILSALIGLPLCYMSKVPISTPVTAMLVKFRFAGSAVFYLPLLLSLPTGHQVKVGLLMLGQLFYLVTSMVDVVDAIPSIYYDDARSLRMSEWQSVWYVVVRGTVPQAIDAIRANAASGWAMLMFVEGAIRSEGGLGVQIMNAQKHVNYDEYFGVVVIIVLIGIGQDWLIGQVRKVCCPYAV